MPYQESNNLKVNLKEMSVTDISSFFRENSKLIIQNNYFKYFENEVNNDTRSGVKNAFKKIYKLKKLYDNEYIRVKKLYEFQNQIAAGNKRCIICGLDEVGRGPLAGPLTVGAVVLSNEQYILGLNDSKKIHQKKRLEISSEIENKAIAWDVYSVSPNDIDRYGIISCLNYAFNNVISKIEKKCSKIDIILLDGNPLHFDKREINIVKGDAKCASIAAASIIAKVHRDKYMINISNKYPNYEFEKNKGYGTAKHIELIKKYGLSDIHRKSFCKNFMQLSLF